MNLKEMNLKEMNLKEMNLIMKLNKTLMNTCIIYLN